ncbi:PIG-L family deacetylase [Rhodocaloribacter litoris]|uniref:PIG-L deacetylase family protein n=1 Tax=Rhodocaloribacter litoris TaxID=2558931 RepID=UPI001421E1A4|nr:PIG-L family deacetylase [Rhodocaloribacter litoris]QXD15376.1 PIG-L family deacetylase [Rhodocaloribacter litoris]
MYRKSSLLLGLLMLPVLVVSAQPEQPVEEWTGKTILLIGAHPDDDSQAHGTLARLVANGNDVHVMLLTLGNVGTKDPNLSRIELAKIRRQEEVNALAQLGIPEENYINLGYDDGRVEYADREEIIERIVFHIRRLRPNVLMAFDPGKGAQRWHKADHRAASYLAADAARAAEWPLLFPGHLVNHNLEAHQVEEYLFFDTADANTWVDITGYVDAKINAGLQYVSQWGPHGQNRYEGPTLTPEQEQLVRERLQRRIRMRDGKPVEAFRHYKGVPDGIGR